MPTRDAEITHLVLAARTHRPPMSRTGTRSASGTRTLDVPLLTVILLGFFGSPLLPLVLGPLSLGTLGLVTAGSIAAGAGARVSRVSALVAWGVVGGGAMLVLGSGPFSMVTSAAVEASGPAVAELRCF
jgi:hypothetical protein